MGNRFHTSNLTDRTKRVYSYLFHVVIYNNNNSKLPEHAVYVKIRERGIVRANKEVRKIMDKYIVENYDNHFYKVIKWDKVDKIVRNGEIRKKVRNIRYFV